MAVADSIVDTSALTRLRRPPVRDVLEPLLVAGRAAICSTTKCELLWSTRNTAEYDVVRQWWDQVELLQVEPADWEHAIDVQRELWHRGQHRAVGWPDLLLSAVAVRHRVTVVHYDRDFELVAEVTGQPMAWVVPAGTVP